MAPQQQTEVENLLAQARSASAARDWETAHTLYQDALEIDRFDAEALLGAGESLRRLKKYAEAATMLEAAIVHYPDDSRIRMELGRVCVGWGSFEQALGQFEELLRRGHKGPPVYIGKIRCLRGLGRPDTLREAVTEARNAAPNDKQLLKEVALIEIDAGRYSAAVDMFLLGENREELMNQIRAVSKENLGLVSAAITRCGRDIELLKTAAEAYVSAGDDVRAVEVFNLLRRRRPDLVTEKVLLNQIAAYSRLGLFDEARILAGQSSKIDSDGQIRFEYADLLWRAGDCKEAVHTVKTLKRFHQLLARRDESHAALPLISAAVEKWPSETALLEELAREQVKAGLPWEAVENFRKILQVETTNRKIALELSGLLRNLSRYNEAEATLRKAFGDRAGDNDYFRECGYIELGKGDRASTRKAGEIWARAKLIDTVEKVSRKLSMQDRVDDAIALCEAASRVMPKLAPFHVACGDAHATCGALLQALACYRQAVRLDPLEETEGRSRAVWALIALRRFDEAEEALREAIRARGERNEYLMAQRGWLEIGRNRFEDAIQAFDAALRVASWNEYAYDGKAYAVGHLEGNEKALHVIEEASARRVRLDRIGLRKAELLWRLNQPDAALDCLRRLASLHRAAGVDDERPLLWQAHILTKLGKAKEAEESLRKALREDQLDRNSLREQLVLVLLETNNYEGALEIAKEVSSSKNEVLSDNILGYVAFAKGDYATAERHFQRVRDAQPWVGTANCNLAGSLVREVSSLPVEEKRLKKAEELCKTALEIDPRSPDVYSYCGILAFRRGRLRDAKEFFSQSIRVHAAEGDYANLASVHLEMDEVEEARMLLEAMARRRPNDAQLLIKMGELCLGTREFDKAVGFFRKAAHMAPSDESTVWVLAQALRRKGDLSESIEVIDRGLRRAEGESSVPLHLLACEVRTAQGDAAKTRDLYWEALSHAEKAKKLRPDRPEPRYHAGVVYSRLQEIDKARKAFEDGRNLDSNQAYAEKALDRLEIWKKRKSRVAYGAGYVIASICVLGLVALAYGYFVMERQRMNEAAMTVLVTAFAFIGAGAILLPRAKQWKAKFERYGVHLDFEGGQEAISGKSAETEWTNIGFPVVSGSLGPR